MQIITERGPVDYTDNPYERREVQLLSEPIFAEAGQLNELPTITVECTCSHPETAMTSVDLTEVIAQIGASFQRAIADQPQAIGPMINISVPESDSALALLGSLDRLGERLDSLGSDIADGFVGGRLGAVVATLSFVIGIVIGAVAF